MDYFGHPSKAYVGTMVAILEIGAFITSLMVGRIGDIIGRRRTIFYGSCVFFIGGALQALATSMPMMMAGRFIAGFGVGALSTIVPVYQSEISPPHNRGKLACIEFTGNIVGYATSVWVDYGCGFIESDYSWRIPLGLQCVMGALLGMGSLVIVESPRYANYVSNTTRTSSLIFADGFWITIMTKRAWLSLPTCTAAATFTTRRLEMNTARSR
jgi:MFS family permease